MPNDNVSGNVNGDLISRAEAIDIVRSMTVSLGGKEIFHPEAKKSVLSALDELPAVDAALVVHGRWKSASAWEGIPTWMCNKCNTGFGRMWTYCPNCGAKMDDHEDDI